tara:strand:+ start:401 stop:637 length:237 start_codon:yes stop_codon:yes gene_type:complete
MGDLLYTLFNYPSEGFFKAATSDLVDNKIWNSVFAIEQGYAYRRSMTCRDMGFQFGKVFQGMLAFEIPDEILFGEVSA